MRTPLIALALLTTVLVPTATLRAYIPITISGVELHWAPADIPVTYVMNSAGSADISDDAEFLAIRQAFQTWEDVTSSTLTFFEDPSADENRTDYAASDIHLILFDETDFTGLFPGSSSTIAVTPITFNSLTGEIVDADIIFNGDDHSFSADRTTSTFDVQSIATHEIGHFLGLDHSASGASTMFPFADTAATTQRSLTSDDSAGASDLYPSGASTGSISGTAKRSSDSSTVKGAHVAALNSDGVVITTTYSAASGAFLLEQLPTGSYTIFAEPLNSPVFGANLSSDLGTGAATDFETTYLGGNPSPTVLAVTAGSTTAAGDLLVGATSAINLTASSAYPVLARRNNLSSLLIAGTGLDGSETLTVTGTGVTFFFTSFSGGTYTLVLQTSSGATLGPRNLEITSSGSAFTVLTGIVEVVEVAPSVTSVSPTGGDTGGGTTITLTGTGFLTGAKVFVGDALATGVSVDSATQITATTPAGTGTVKVMVQNPDGQLFVSASIDFAYASQPTVTSIFPDAGSTGGATSAVITGSNFASGLTVTVGGTSATVDSVTATAVTITTPAGSAGSADVVVTNPGSLSDTLISGFTYVSVADPTITTINPASGAENVETQVTITGTGFQSGALVYLGRDSDGTGGVLGAFITVVSSTEITFVTPIMSAGAMSVHVENPGGAVAQMPVGFTYTAVAVGGGGGGGGGCFAVPPMSTGGGGGYGAAAAGALLPYALMIIITLMMRRRRRVV